MLPPEMEICQAYDVGRQTVRQAMARLVDEDLVERFAGRGTFVQPRADRPSSSSTAVSASRCESWAHPPLGSAQPGRRPGG